ncbi:MAG: retroviral-like aspartic protease family protein [Desulfurococcales archaeon]|nr:retroviral-like aspartic protease family protein [Desulfurococcales archaeon]MEB3788845.1 retroviral-like aspartic protease family protein [Desulfurococcales archaeon]
MTHQCLHGYFYKLRPDSPEYPFIEAKLYLNNEYKGKIAFLIDTGAGATLIVYKDALRLGISPRSTGKTIKIIGVSGSETAALLNTPIKLELLESHENKDNLSSITISLSSIQVEKPREVKKRMRGSRISDIMTRPSLLGWDVLKDLSIIIDYPRKLIRICRE